MKIGAEVRRLDRRYSENLERFAFDRKMLHDLLRQRSVRYGDFILHGEMAPLLLSQKEIAQYARDAELVFAASVLFTETALRERPEWLADCLPDRRLRKLLETDPGYPCPIPCCRFDSFPRKGRPVFIELNTDGCSGMSNLDAYHGLFLEMVRDWPGSGLAGYDTERILPHVLETLLKCYAAFRRNRPRPGRPWPARPVIAILDWREEPTSWEFFACREYFRSQGYEALVADPRDLRYENGAVFAGGREIHLVYRRLLGADWSERFKDLKAFTRAYQEGRLCVVGSPRSQVAFSKRLFHYLRREEMLERYSPAMREAVLATVPWTMPLSRRMAPCEFRGRTIDPLPFIREHRELFVLKPCISKCGFGIVQGCHATEEEWRQALEAALDQDFIIQEFIPLETGLFPVHGRSREYEKRYLHAGIYLFGGKFSGFFGRTCKDPLLCLRNGERMLPILWKK